MGFTYSLFRSTPRMARIDYVWFSAHFVARDAVVESDSGSSDHHPVIAKLGLKEVAR